MYTTPWTLNPCRKKKSRIARLRQRTKARALRATSASHLYLSFILLPPRGKATSNLMSRTCAAFVPLSNPCNVSAASFSTSSKIKGAIHVFRARTYTHRVPKECPHTAYNVRARACLHLVHVEKPESEASCRAEVCVAAAARTSAAY